MLQDKYKKNWKLVDFNSQTISYQIFRNPDFKKIIPPIYNYFLQNNDNKGHEGDLLFYTYSNFLDNGWLSSG